MPKMKTHKGLAKRVKVTARGKVKSRRAFKGHLLSGRSGKRLRRISRPNLLRSANARRVREALGA